MSLKVLVVDPDWRFTRAASRYLEDHAHLVVRETRVRQAQERAHHWQPDLLIVAAESADKDFMESIYAMDCRPAVLLTGWMDRYDVAWRAWQMGGDELLMKPILKAGELQESITAALQNRALGTRGAKHAPAAASA